MPSVRLKITIIAKCSGSMPSLTATGARIGTSTITPGSGSMKMPNSSRNTLTMMRNIHGDEVHARPSHSASVCGTPSMVSTQANEADRPMMISTEAESSAERARMSGSAFHSSVR